jgi:hypothetical protein
MKKNLGGTDTCPEKGLPPERALSDKCRCAQHKRFIGDAWPRRSSVSVPQAQEDLSVGCELDTRIVSDAKRIMTPASKDRPKNN